MKVKVIEGEKIKIPKKDVIFLIENYLKTGMGKEGEIADIKDVNDVEVTIGEVKIEEIEENELLTKSVKQILKTRGYDTKKIFVEVIKEEGKK